MTPEELLALPDFGFRKVTQIVEGKRIEYPVMPDVRAHAVTPDDLLCAHLPDGELYTFGQFADGSWYKKRVGL